MKQKLQCPSCNSIFEIDMQEGVEQCNCPSCGADLEITAVFNGLGEALSITTSVVEKKNKFSSIDASGVKEIAEMQRYIDNLENYLWRMAMFIKGQDDGKTVLEFTEKDSVTDFATTAIYNFIKEHKGKIEEIESLLTQSDDVDDIVYSYHQIESKIKENKEAAK